MYYIIDNKINNIENIKISLEVYMVATSKIKTIDREKYMTEEEVRLLRSVCRDRAAIDLKKGRQGHIRMWMIIDIVTTSGLRVSEIANLDIGDYFPCSKRPYLKVKSAKKRKVEYETVPVSKDLVEHLNGYLDWRRDCFNEDISKDKPLLTSSRGQRYTVSALQKLFKKACENAGLDEKYSIHSARHTLGFLLLKKTKNLRLVQKQLRHSSPQITAAFYADVAFEEQQDALNGLFEEMSD